MGVAVAGVPKEVWGRDLDKGCGYHCFICCLFSVAVEILGQSLTTDVATSFDDPMSKHAYSDLDNNHAWDRNINHVTRHVT